FAGLGWLRGEWRLAVDGRTIAEGRLPRLTIAPQTSHTVALKWPRLTFKPGEEAYLHVTFFAAAKTPWWPVAHKVAGDQALTARRAGLTVTRHPRGTPLSIVGDAGGRIVANDAINLRVDAESGLLGSVSWQGREVMRSGPRLQVWRAATDN